MRKAPLLQRLRAKKQQQAQIPIVMGVSWYSEVEWAKVKAFAADPVVFESSFEEWSAMAEQALRDLTGANIEPAKVFIEANELKLWCRNKGLPNNASARGEFVTEKLRTRRGSTDA